MDDPVELNHSPQLDPSDEGFVDADPSTPLDDVDDTTPIVDDINNYSTRELRPPKRGLQPTTWLDNDDTGNYDPAQERIKRRVQPRPQQRIRLPGDPIKVRGPVERPTLKVSITFTSEERRKKCSDIISQIKDQDATDQEGYKLRTRARDEESETPNGTVDLTAKPFARGCWGCAALAGNGQSQCSLLHDERVWPCTSCEEDEHDCQLITQPVRKRQCEQCKRRKVPCSYTYTRNHGATCTQCDSVSLPCIAGPAVQFIRQRIRLDRNWEEDPLPTKKKGKFRANEECWECSQAGTECRYGSEDDPTPCEACKQNDKPCTIGKGPPPQPKRTQKSKKRKRAAEEETVPVNAEVEESTEGTQESPVKKKKHEETPQDDRRDSAAQIPTTLKMPNTCNPHAIAAAKKREQSVAPAAKNNPLPLPQRPQPTPAAPRLINRPRGRPIFRKISTSFCHPIQFNCDQSPERSDRTPNKPKGCSFCIDPLYRFFGLGYAPKVEVIDFQNHEPFTETQHGHKSRGRASTRLCAECTTERMDVLLCEQHTMARIPNTNYTDAEFDESMEDILDGVHVGNMADYCALCGHLAQYECQNEPCGLRLCGGCAVTFVRRHGSDLQHMLDNSRHGATESAPLGLRADAELLDVKKGTVARFLDSMFGVRWREKRR
ncbi:hypothetical protein PRZ48_000773 [Zasmidium cellare]|uniref:Zn(2)-C6 fungal-type domain-containing protein n=1 Tax=Zasmidium cellare TaxID=395010 RepID=A0ABR0EZD6_ZASCE|nr:hypothetical protein PRZ48_000773 [Zasmidium cellare]